MRTVFKIPNEEKSILLKISKAVGDAVVKKVRIDHIQIDVAEWYELRKELGLPLAFATIDRFEIVGIDVKVVDGCNKKNV